MPMMNWNFLFVLWMLVVGFVVGFGWALAVYTVGRLTAPRPH